MLQALYEAGISPAPEHAFVETADPTELTQITILSVTPPPHAVLHGPQGPTDHENV